MDTHRLRQRIQQDLGSGSGDYRTLIQDFSNQVNSQESVLNRLTISSLALIITFLLSYQLEWAFFLFEIAKPVYLVYLVSILFVDILAPVLTRFERWLTGNFWQNEEELNQAEIREDEPDEVGELVDNSDEEEYNDADNNFMVQERGDPVVTKRSPNGRRLGIRRHAQEARPLILKAIESELRKETLKS